MVSDVRRRVRRILRAGVSRAGIFAMALLAATMWSCRTGGATYKQENCSATRDNIDVRFSQPRSIVMLVPGRDSMRVDSVTSVRGRGSHTCGDTLHLRITRVETGGRNRNIPGYPELRLVPDTTTTSSPVPPFLRMTLLVVLFAAVIGVAAS